MDKGKSFSLKKCFLVIARKMAAVVSVCTGFALVHLLCQWSNITDLWLGKNAIPLLVVLFGGVFLFLYSRWNEFTRRVRNCNTWDGIAIFCCVVFYGIVQYFFHSRFAESCGVGALILCPFIILGVVLIKVFRPKNQSVTKTKELPQCPITELSVEELENQRKETTIELPQRSITTFPVEELLKWAQKDEPAKEVRVDYFEFTHKVQKIVKRLKSSIKAKENAAIGLCGQYGAGKTTVTYFVETVVGTKIDIENKTDKSTVIYTVIYRRVSCWGFSDVQSVQEYVIKEIIEAMTETGIDTDHLVGIPKQYVRALAKAHTFFEAMLEFFFDEKTPENILKEIDDTLCGNGKKLVLILEDLDRSEEKEFREPVFATLWRLRNTKHISFIITGFYRQPGKEDATDFAKICDYVEEMPMITLQQKIEILTKIARYHTDTDTDKLFPNDIKLPNKDFQQLNEGHCDHSINLDTVAYPKWNVFDLIDTPRNLKMFIRDLNVAWNILHGECDYMELFTLTALRNGGDVGRSIFGFIVENLSELRKGNDGNKEYKQSKIYKEYAPIIDWLFLDAGSARFARRIRYATPVDYFKRIVNEHISEGENDRDQKFLQKIHNWNQAINNRNNGNREELIEMILHTNESNVLLCNRWFEGIELDEESVEYLMNKFTEGIREVDTEGIQKIKYPYEPTITLCHLLKSAKLLDPGTVDLTLQKMIFNLFLKKIKDGLKRDKKEQEHSIFYLLAYKFFSGKSASIEELWEVTKDDYMLISFPDFNKFTSKEDKRVLIEKFREGAEPVKCSNPMETERRKAEIQLVQKAAKKIVI